MARKVMLICGSPRLEGNTCQLLRMCGDILKEEGLETKTYLLAEMQIRGCTACGMCVGGECVQDDDLNAIVGTLRGCSGLIVGTPVYFGSARGDLLNTLQRIGAISNATDKFLSGMVGGPIAVARRGGHTAVLQQLLLFYLINGMTVPGSTYWNMVFGSAPGDVWNDREGVETIRQFSRNVAETIAKLH
jgi:multimeric flavodoxin WrbA